MTKDLTCTSCKKKITNLHNSTSFKCPSCAETIIVRCANCREIAARYTCSKCKFSGPN